MLFTNKQKTVRVTDIKSSDIINFMKCQCKMKVIARDDHGQVVDFLWLLDRTNRQKIIVSQTKGARKKKDEFGSEVGKYEVTYQEAWKMIGELCKLGTPEIIMLKVDYESRKPLFDVLPYIRQDIIAGLISFDYKNDMFTIKSKNASKFIDEIYYWPETTRLYAFTQNGPVISGKPTGKSIEDILC